MNNIQNNKNKDVRIENLAGKAWLSIPNFENHLLDELNIPHLEEPMSATRLPEGSAIYGDIIYLEEKRFNDAEQAKENPVYWKRLCMEEPFIAHFSSIKEASEILRSIQRNWVFYPFNCFRRGTLIQEKLPYISKKPRAFPYDIPDSEMGLWTLLDKNTIFASAKTSSPFPRGEIFFEEDKVNPPSRAYLKMWEALTLLNFYLKQYKKNHPEDTRKENAQDYHLPDSNSRCLDAGACPGGWTWVLNNLGCDIIAVDRSPLADNLMKQKNIEFIKHDVFTIKPEEIGKIDWFCSDVICYPPKLYEWVLKWLESGLCENFICTIKMQGEPDNETVKKFANIPNSKIIHLTANKHELTWVHAPFL